MPPGDSESLAEQAAAWFARMRGPEAERDRVAFEAWLAADPGHRSAYDRMALRWQQAGLLAHSAAGRERAGLAAPRAGGAVRRYALAAGLAAAVAIGAVVRLWPGGTGSGAPAAVVSAQLSSPVGIRHVRLVDGTRITLDTETSLSVRISSGERRIVLERGRARFEVAHDADRPFIVAAGDGEVVAFGTVFDVSVEGAAPRVSLLRGSVEVRGAAPGPGRTRPVIRLTPGQALSLGPGAPVPRAPPPAEAGWASGMIAFEDAPLGAVLATANRYSVRKILLADVSLAALRVTGSFRAGRPDELAAALAAAFGLTVAPRGSDLELRRRMR